ncbi:MAG: tripartite tricarboxylate transporter TctB family protein [Mailhella sp.]|nr:tripartite tricarboxylate transporter TctB family protein [Mailhella sp.]
MSIYQRDMIGYAIILILSCSLYFGVIPAYSPEYPGYGVPESFMPDIAAVCMGLLSILGLVQTVKKRDKETKAGKMNWIHLIKFFVPCLLLMPAMATIGYLISGMLFLSLIQFLCGQRSAWCLILVSMVPVAVFYALMVYALGVPLP